MNGQRLKPWLVMGLIFVVGIVTGAALTFGFRPDWSHPPGAQQMRNQWMEHLTHRLDLTPDQQAKIQPILTDAGNQIQSLHRDEVERISRLMQAASDKITPLLTPAQQAQMKQMESERKREFSGHIRPWDMSHGHFGPGHHMGSPPDDSSPTAPPPGP